MKRLAGILLLLSGLILGIIGFDKQAKDNEILKIGKLELKKDRSENVNTFMIAGIAMVACGVLVLAINKNPH